MPGSKPTTTSLKNAISGIAIARSFCPSLQMAGKVLVHLEHRHLVLAEDPPELIVRQNFASVLWVLQVVQANVLPHLAHHLVPGAAGPSRPPRPAPPTGVAAAAGHSPCLRGLFSPAFWLAST